MITRNEIERLQGATGYGSDGSKVGKVDQVYVDDETNEPTWATVNTGLFGSSTTFVPVDGAVFDGDDVRFAHDKDLIKDAPRFDVDQHIGRQDEEKLHRYYGLSYPTAPAGVDTTGADASLTRSEERLKVGTDSQEAGRARLRKYTTTEQENVTVPVAKERLVVDREPVEGRPRGDGITDEEEVEEITLREERAVVDKETVPVEEVRVTKDAVVEDEKVSADLRKEKVEVDETGKRR